MITGLKADAFIAQANRQGIFLAARELGDLQLTSTNDDVNIVSKGRANDGAGITAQANEVDIAATAG